MRFCSRERRIPRASVEENERDENEIFRSRVFDAVAVPVGRECDVAGCDGSERAVVGVSSRSREEVVGFALFAMRVNAD